MNWLFSILLPLFTISPASTSVTFDVDSTWHTVEGTATQLSGSVMLENGDGPLQLEVHIPVVGLDTQNGRRDARMREVLAAEQFPEILFKGTEFHSACDFAKIKPDESCSGVLAGDLTIRGHTEHIKFPVAVRADAQTLHFTARYQLDWSTYGVEDPSILIAKLDKNVSIKIELKIPKVL